MSEFNLVVLGQDEAKTLWIEIKKTLEIAFNNAVFNNRFDSRSPIEEVYKAITEPEQEGIKHILAMDPNKKILAGFFDIPTIKSTEKDYYDVGWFFSIELEYELRHKVVDMMIEKAHELAKLAGYKYFITEMGTEAGAKYMKKKYNYVHAPIETQQNRWIKIL